jgi:hypothetical protein
MGDTNHAYHREDGEHHQNNLREGAIEAISQKKAEINF